MDARITIVVAAVVALAGCVDDSNGNPASGDAGSIGAPDGSLPGIDGAAPGTCLGGTQCADGACHDLSGDHANCGACGHACGDGQVCSSGACAASCGSGTIACAGSCVDPQTSHTSCGASGDCAGGNAGTACASAEACIAGHCVAACGSSANGALEICNGVCTDTDFDVSNCGACGVACAVDGGGGTATCFHGVCGVSACPANTADCDRDPSDGCEANLLTSPLDCGACGAACAVGACTNGTCAPDPEWASGPLPGDLRAESDFVIEHGGALQATDGGAVDASWPSDAAFDPDATGGANVDAAACASDAGQLAINTTSCATSPASCDDLVLDQATGLVWARWSTASSNDIAMAQCYCASARFAGLSGWRLPTRLELATIADFGRVAPAVSAGAFPSIGVNTRVLSSSVTKAVVPPYSYELKPSGEMDEWGAGGGNTTTDAVLCVLDATTHAGGAPPPARYQITTNGTPDDLTDDTVLDTRTSLRWERAFSAPVTWDASGAPGSAQAYCASLSIGTYTSGWRVPAIRELVTIVDPRHHPTFDPIAFPHISIGPTTGNTRRFWTAQGDVGRTALVDGGTTFTSAWAVGVGAGHLISWGLTSGDGSRNVARCVHAP